MNRTAEQNRSFNSNSRIFEAHFEEYAIPQKSLRQVMDLFLYIIAIAFRFITSAKAVAWLRVVGVAGSLVGMIGIIGAVEQGNIGLGSAFLMGSALIAIEYLCLRPKRNQVGSRRPQ